MRTARTARPQTSQVIHVPAPVGGLDTVSPASMLPPGRCMQLVNLVASDYGLRARLGSREWVTGLTGAADNKVRTLLPFTGSSLGGTKDRLFAVTSSGIWDVTSSAERATAAWTISTAYVVGNRVLNDSGKSYVCVTAGTSAGSGGPTGTGVAITDGSAVWDYVAGGSAKLITFGTQTGDAGYGVGTTVVSLAGVHYLMYADEVNGLHVYIETTDAWHKMTAGAGGIAAFEINNIDPADIVFVAYFKNRCWFAVRDSPVLWYLGLGAVGGDAASFSQINKFGHGGSVRGFWSWTRDGGIGIDDHLVVVSDGGDVVIWKGTDPSDPDKFGLAGVWFVGQVPTGRQLATNYGGDLLLLSRMGPVTLSKLVNGEPSAQYETAPVANLFNRLSTTDFAYKGWSVRLHPEDNTLIVTVPSSGEDANTTQLAMSLVTKGWSTYTELPIYCCEPWQGKLYYGTLDGKVGVNTGYVDGVALADPSDYTAISWSVLTRFDNLANGRQKRVQMIRTALLSDGGPVPFAVKAVYDYDLSQVLVPSSGVAGGDTWDNGLWDTARWAGEYTTTQAVRGGNGVGVAFAVLCAGTAIARSILLGFDVTFDQGGFL